MPAVLIFQAAVLVTGNDHMAWRHAFRNYDRTPIAKAPRHYRFHLMRSQIKVGGPWERQLGLLKGGRTADVHKKASVLERKNMGQ